MPIPTMITSRTTLTAAFTLAAVVGAATPVLSAPATERVSVRTGGAQVRGPSQTPALSGDGRFVAFTSRAKNLVPGDTNVKFDVFVRDRQSGTTRRVSVGPNGVQGDGDSVRPDVSADGRFVAFASNASNLVPGDTNGELDVFLHDTTAGETRLVSVRRDGARGDGPSDVPAVSDDGRHVVFRTEAERLTPGDTGDERHIVLRDMATGTLRLVSAGPGGTPADSYSDTPAISADGRLVGFTSDAANLVAADANVEADVFVYDQRTRELELASVGPGGVQANGISEAPAFSTDGSIVAFFSNAANLVPGDSNGEVDIFVRDLRAGTTRRVSVGPGRVQADAQSFGQPAISATGRFVAFESDATNLVPGDTNEGKDVFVHDLEKGVTSRANVGPGGVQAASGRSFDVDISADGRNVAFVSEAANLVPSDTNDVADVFVRTH